MPASLAVAQKESAVVVARASVRVEVAHVARGFQ